MSAGSKCGFGCIGAVVLGVLILILASIQELSPEEQLLVKDPSGYWVKNGPLRQVIVNFYPKEKRKASALKPEQYALVQNEMTGEPRHEVGPKLLFLGAYDKIVRVSSATVLHKDEYAIVKNRMDGTPRHEPGPQLLFLGVYDRLVEVRPKVVLQRDEYIRLVDEADGSERVLQGPQTFVPEALESSPQGPQRAVFLDTESSVLVLNRANGVQRLVQNGTLFIPAPYEEILEVRRLIHVLPHEAVVVRDAHGSLQVHSGADAGNTGTAFFLPPYCKLVQMTWSDHSRADFEDISENADVPKMNVTKLDLRARRLSFKYKVRTSDNVKLKLEGTIFWRVFDVTKMINATADPEGDVWHHARSALIEAVSNTTLAVFMSGFNSIVTGAFSVQAHDRFYSDRGVEMQSMELTRFDCVEARTAEILQEIIQETTNRINRLTAQESENEVKAAALNMDIKLERQRTELIETQTQNERLQAQMQGEAEGLRLVRGAAAFIEGLNESLPSIDGRVELYRLHETLKSRNADTQHLAQGSAHLFLTPEDLKLKLNMPSGGMAPAEL